MVTNHIFKAYSILIFAYANNFLALKYLAQTWIKNIYQVTLT